MTSAMIAFFVFWGIWLFVPLLIDGTTALSYLVGGFWMNRTRHRARLKHVITSYPKVSLIIPVYNGQRVIGQCIESIMKQTYPHDKLEVIVVDNMSADRTAQVVEEKQKLPFEGDIRLISLPFKGKSFALNAGIYRASGEIICNIDADVQLHPQAILAVARAFDYDSTLAAVTGAVEVLPWPDTETSPLRRIMGECEFLEYYAGFRIGRQYQSLTNSLFTLAGAFSGFRREILLQTSLYQGQTASEDTYLTFEIHQKFKGMHLECLPDAIAYVEPVPSISSLYAQRVRWQRGQLEVAALFQTFNNPRGIFKGIWLPRALVIDHTLAFPRVIWTFLMPMLYFFGYPLAAVVSATLSMYLVYLAVDGIYAVVTYTLAEREARPRILRNWWVIFMLPVFRWTVFWFRFAGFLTALMDPPQWRTQDPVQQTIIGLNQAKTSILLILTHLSKLHIRLLLVELVRMFRG